MKNIKFMLCKALLELTAQKRDGRKDINREDIEAASKTFRLNSSQGIQLFRAVREDGYYIQPYSWDEWRHTEERVANIYIAALEWKGCSKRKAAKLFARHMDAGTLYKLNRTVWAYLRYPANA